MPDTKSRKTATTAGTLDGRTRNWACVVYPESAPANWLEIIAEEKAPFFVSPLHDSDTDPQGQPKKPHYHVIYAPESKKSEQQIKAIFEKFAGVGLEPVGSLRGYARYLCHLDNPEKAQYSPEDVRCFGGADYNSVVSLPTDKYKAVSEMMAYCAENNIYSFSDLCDYARDHRFDWFRLLCDSSAIIMKEYLKSKSWTAEKCASACARGRDIPCDENGEILGV